MSKAFIFLATLLVSASCVATEVCGGTVQTFWNLDQQKSQLTLNKVFKHPETKFCEVDLEVNSNAEVQILDSKNSMLRKYRTYISTEAFYDTLIGGKLHGGHGFDTKSVIQLKFAGDSQFKTAKYIKIQFQNGKSYGPARF